jgi:hypothetical protein
MRETLVRGNDAGEEKSGPRSQTSARIKSAGPRKMLLLGRILTLSGDKNQMKSFRGRSLYHKEPLSGDLSDEIAGIQQSKIMAD